MAVEKKLRLTTNFFLGNFILRPTETTWVLLNISTRNFQNSSPFEREAYFYVTITGNFERFQYFTSETNFLKKRKLFSKNLSTIFQFKVLSLKMEHFHTKLHCQKSMLRQIELVLQNERITKNGVVPVATFIS